MTQSNPFDRYLRTPEAAKLLGLSQRTLEKHRTFGTGPAYHKLGGRVVYAPEDIKAWATRGSRQSTSDPGKGIVHPAAPMKNDIRPQVQSLAPKANRRPR
jgi:predicted DNA-binding transcriptional regulator AlpA